MLLHYCFWSHITFPSASLGVLERKLKELQQTVILHLLPGCSTPASLSPKGCMADTKEKIHPRNAAHSHPLGSSTAPAAAIISCCSLDSTERFLRNAVVQICVQVSRVCPGAVGAAMSVLPAPDPAATDHGTVWVGTQQGWLKVLGRSSVRLF